MSCIKIIYKEENNKVTINEIYSYIGKSGIWALYGKKGEVFECLNVGKCVDVGREILYDVSCLHNLAVREDGNEDYINQFAEFCGLKYRKGQTQEYLYPHISNLHYDTIMFVYVYNKSDMHKEREFAWLTHAKFWRNGSIFKVTRDYFYESNRKTVLETRNTITTAQNLEDLVRLLKKYNFYSNEKGCIVKK
ncbi:MAG: hypothetical protein NC548_45215 [Lachnospiraceae bacterium]|nr:hypothetical protein [Lachnospiraceae bacterium]